MNCRNCPLTCVLSNKIYSREQWSGMFDVREKRTQCAASSPSVPSWSCYGNRSLVLDLLPWRRKTEWWRFWGCRMCLHGETTDWSIYYEWKREKGFIADIWALFCLHISLQCDVKTHVSKVTHNNFLLEYWDVSRFYYLFVFNLTDNINENKSDFIYMQQVGQHYSSSCIIFLALLL